VRLRRKKDEEPAGSDAEVVTAAPPRAPGGESPLSVDASSNSDAHPELLVGAAFVGGFALAQIMKRFGR
jgi:hypothetical protein